jgi:hypothetical protein
MKYVRMIRNYEALYEIIRFCLTVTGILCSPFRLTTNYETRNLIRTSDRNPRIEAKHIPERYFT